MGLRRQRGRLHRKGELLAFSSWAYGCTVGAADVESAARAPIRDGSWRSPSARSGSRAACHAEVFDYENASIATKDQVRPTRRCTHGWWPAAMPMRATPIAAHGARADPAAPSRIITWEWDPYIGQDPAGIHKLGPDDFVCLLGWGYGGNVRWALE